MSRIRRPEGLQPTLARKVVKWIFIPKDVRHFCSQSQNNVLSYTLLSLYHLTVINVAKTELVVCSETKRWNPTCLTTCDVWHHTTQYYNIHVQRLLAIKETYSAGGEEGWVSVSDSPLLVGPCVDSVTMAVSTPGDDRGAFWGRLFSWNWDSPVVRRH